MKRVAWFLPLLLIALVVVPTGRAQSTVKFYDSAEYDAFMSARAEKDDLKKAAQGEQFLADFPNADPQLRSEVYSMIFLAYASRNDWAKILETYDRMGLFPKLTGDQKMKFSQIASTARQRLGK